jgi:hypothetical protein
MADQGNEHENNHIQKFCEMRMNSCIIDVSHISLGWIRKSKPMHQFTVGGNGMIGATINLNTRGKIIIHEADSIFQ